MFHHYLDCFNCFVKVRQVKILGGLLVVEEGKWADWKLLVIDAEDPDANVINDLSDVRTSNQILIAFFTPVSGFQFCFFVTKISESLGFLTIDISIISGSLFYAGLEFLTNCWQISAHQSTPHIANVFLPLWLLLVCCFYVRSWKQCITRQTIKTQRRLSTIFHKPWIAHANWVP